PREPSAKHAQEPDEEERSGEDEEERRDLPVPMAAVCVVGSELLVWIAGVDVVQERDRDEPENDEDHSAEGAQRVQREPFKSRPLSEMTPARPPRGRLKL